MAGSSKRTAEPGEADGTGRKRSCVKGLPKQDVYCPSADVAPKSYPFHFPSRDSGVTAQRAFQWLVSPEPAATFLKFTFEKKPALFRAPSREEGRFECMLSVNNVEQLICSSARCLRYGDDLDVTRYRPHEGRSTLNAENGALAGLEAWQKFRDDACSIRLLRPQEHMDSLWALCSMLESFFGSVVGANAYLTPSNSQGFAPHFDDIDAFVCQVSGRKRWRVYAPRGDGCDALPRRSSVDFTQDEMESVKLVYDTILEPGDMLYLPRGAIHQAECPNGDPLGECGRNGSGKRSDPSLHVTLSACQRSTWTDFLLATVASAVESASHEALRLRRTLPLRFTDYAGVGSADVNKARRAAFDESVKKCLRSVADSYPIDAAADLVAERFMRERLPPWEAQTSAWTNRNSLPAASVKGANLESWVCATGRGIGRVVMDRDGELPAIVHCLDNLRGAHRSEDESSKNGDVVPLGRMTCTADEALAIDFVLKAYPKAVRVGDLPLRVGRERQELADILIEIGLAKLLH